MNTSLAMAVAACLCAWGSPTKPVPAPASPAPAQPEPTQSKPRAIADLSNEELIAQLPPSRQEVTRDTKNDTWVDNPVSTEWRTRVAAGKVTAEQFGAAIRKCAMLRSSPVCFEGEPYHVWMRVPAWLPGYTATAKPHLPEYTCVKAGDPKLDFGCGNAMAATESEESFQTIGVLPKNTTKVIFHVTLSPSSFPPIPPLYFPRPPIGSANANWSGQIELPVEIIPKAAAQPVDTPALTALVREAAGISCSNGFSSEGPSLYFIARTRRPATGPLNSTLICLKIELLKDGVVVATRSTADPDEAYGEKRWRQLVCDADFIRGDLAKAVILGQDIERYTVKVSGIAPTSQSQWYRVQYWSGQYTVPLKDILEPERGTRPAGLGGPGGT